MIFKSAIQVLALTVIAASSSSGEEPPVVVFQTELGEIRAEIYLDRAPITAANFLRLVDEGALDGATFYRTVTLDNQPDNDVKIEVIQGGMGPDDENVTAPTIRHETTTETGILHRDGVLSMARNEPGTASSEFFICLGDQPSLDHGGDRNPDGAGFATFGKVIHGMDVVRRIQRQPVDGQWLEPPIPIHSITRQQ